MSESSHSSRSRETPILSRGLSVLHFIKTLSVLRLSSSLIKNPGPRLIKVPGALFLTSTCYTFYFDRDLLPVLIADILLQEMAKTKPEIGKLLRDARKARQAAIASSFKVKTKVATKVSSTSLTTPQALQTKTAGSRVTKTPSTAATIPAHLIVDLDSDSSDNATDPAKDVNPFLIFQTASGVAGRTGPIEPMKIIKAGTQFFDTTVENSHEGAVVRAMAVAIYAVEYDLTNEVIARRLAAGAAAGHGNKTSL